MFSVFLLFLLMKFYEILLFFLTVLVTVHTKIERTGRIHQLTTVTKTLKNLFFVTFFFYFSIFSTPVFDFYLREIMSHQGNILLPYAVQYGTGNPCATCNSKILSMNIAIMLCEKSQLLDKTATWHHLPCFFGTLDKTKDDINSRSIRGFDHLKWEDQQNLRKDIQKYKIGYSSPPRPSRTHISLSRIKVSTARSARGKCGNCDDVITKGDMKMGHKAKFYHPVCFYKMFDDISESLDKLQGWDQIDAEKKKKAIEEFEAFISAKPKPPPVPMVDLDDGFAEIDDEELADLTLCDQGGYKRREQKRRHSDASEEDEDAKKKKKETIVALRKDQLEKQAKSLYELRRLFKSMSAVQLELVLNDNEQDFSEDRDEQIDQLVDIAFFGCPARCEQCNRGHFVFRETSQTYECTGYKSVSLRCTATSKNPKRTPFNITTTVTNRMIHVGNSFPFNGSSERIYPKAEEVVANPKEGRRKSVIPAEMFTKSYKLTADSESEGATNRHCIKKGTAVDMKFEHASNCHVVKPYNVALSFTDLVENKNSYYKIQLLKADHEEKFYVFHSWGRVGTDFGGHKHTGFGGKKEAVKHFEELFLDKTANVWKYRQYFRQLPGLFNYVETDHSELETLPEIVPGSRSQMAPRIKEVIIAIFDVTRMKKAMQSFDMDIDKMPLGRVANNQVMKAFEVLTLISEYIANGQQDTWQMVDATNQFYTLIPHNFGMNKPPAIDNLRMVQEKNRMLNMLLEIKFAYDQQANVPNWKDPVDLNFELLKCQLRPLEKNGHMWEMIKKYMEKTHGETHHVQVDLVDILEVQRHGEAEKFQKELGNRKLLWHGSATTNIAGIVGQGLRIAPKEAPSSGYMFGKGIYFADMFTKSFFYCRAAKVGEECYMMLCDVALGKSHDLLKHDSLMCKERLPPGTHSVLGLGRQCPNAIFNFPHPDGYVVPKGTPHVQLGGKHGVDYELLYNEYIVYDTSQVEMKYLVRLKVHAARHRL